MYYIYIYLDMTQGWHKFLYDYEFDQNPSHSVPNQAELSFKFVPKGQWAGNGCATCVFTNDVFAYVSKR